MFVAIPVWQGRVSPVFDVASQLLIVQLHDAREVSRTQESLDGLSGQARAQYLAGKGIGTLICGAISQPLEAQLAAGGIHVVRGICGYIAEVLEAFAAGRLNEERFALPGYLPRAPTSGGPPR